MTIKTKALVIKEYVVGESDKYITLFTKELGKIQVLAPHAKKYAGGFATGTQLFVYGEFILVQYRDTYKLRNVEILEMFHDIREDLYALSYASYIVEFISTVTQEGLEGEELLKLTLRALKALTPELQKLRLVRRVFEMRALVLLGFMPSLTHCVDCDKTINENEKAIYLFAPEAGGVVCEKCKTFYRQCLPTSYSTLYTMQYVITSPFERLFKFEVSETILKEFEKVCEAYMPYYIDKHFKTLDFIEKLNNL